MSATMRVWLLAIAICALPPMVANAADTPASAADQAAGASGQTHVPRLRFKNGPLCMCGNGLTEEDIARAEKKRQEKEGRSNATGADQHSERRKQ